MHDVFISYGSKDAGVVDAVCRVLETNGIKCWIAPRDIPTGSNYAREIPAAIRGCTVFLLMMSREAQSSIWVTRELDLAVNERKIVFPMMLEDVPLNDEFNFYLTGFQRYEAFERSSAVLEAMVLRMKALLAVKPKTAASTDDDSARFTQKVPSETAGVRFDGLYCTAPVRGFRHYYRFYPDGAMVSAYTSATPAKAATWLNLDKYEGGRVLQDGEITRMEEPLTGKHRYSAVLTLTKTGLKMKGFNTYSQREVEKECTFLPFAELNG